MGRDTGKNSNRTSAVTVEEVERKVPTFLSRIPLAKQETFVKMTILLLCCMLGKSSITFFIMYNIVITYDYTFIHF